MSTRTVYRYFDLLRDVGIPVCYDEQKGGHVIASNFRVIASNFRLRVPQLNDDELVILVLAAHTSAFFVHGKFGPLVRQAISKLLSQASVELRDEATNVLRACLVAADVPPHTPEEDERYLQILTAIRRQRQIRITVQTDEGPEGVVQTKVAPYRLMINAEGTYLIGRSSWHRKTCSFSLAQIRRIEMTDDPYRLPPHHVMTKLRPPQARRSKDGQLRCGRTAPRPDAPPQKPDST